jgi:hypothetical protein
MSDIDKFHEWVETQSPLALREYTHAQSAWIAKGELDAVRIKEWQDIASKYAIYEEQADVKIAELKAKLDKAKEALEFECGGRCNAEYNPCNAREVLKELDK